MNAAPVVVAFSDSRPVRETLSVLLEHDCELRFMTHDGAPAADTMLADLALVAVRQPAGLLHDLTRQWPTLPIVAVQTAAEMAPPMTPAYPGIASVPLEPHAIRAAVMQGLVSAGHAPLWAAVWMLADSLQAELSYPLAVLRSFVVADALICGADTVFAAIAREQSYVLGEAIDHLERFRARSRRTETSPEFLVALCRALEQPDAPAELPLLCECSIDFGMRMPAGPLTLAPLIAAFLRAHLRRRADSPLITIGITAEGALLRYRPRPAQQAVSNSWPLLLAALAARPWRWQLSHSLDNAEGVIVLRPA
ncbi:MAG: hypothetical protein ABSA52_07370 [Candidatus Binatia bacterium]|jgi:hypothetical protein